MAVGECMRPWSPALADPFRFDVPQPSRWKESSLRRESLIRAAKFLGRVNHNVAFIRLIEPCVRQYMLPELLIVSQRYPEKTVRLSFVEQASHSGLDAQYRELKALRARVERLEAEQLRKLKRQHQNLRDSRVRRRVRSRH